MSITTKTGDEGMTSLIGGQRVKKCDDRVEAYGSLDELSAFVGVLYDFLPDAEDDIKASLSRIQKNLFSIEAFLACAEEGRIPHLSYTEVSLLEARIQQIEASLPPLRSFVIPGGCLVASFCHVCRTVCRRSERAAVRMGASGVELQYLNRLSDYFFLLARKLS